MPWEQFVDQKFARPPDQEQEEEEDAVSDSPTPIPAVQRPPPPTYQDYQHQQQTDAAAVNNNNASIMSTMLSFSNNVSGDLQTLPSIHPPPSPVSKPSDSLMLSQSIESQQQQHQQPPLSVARQQRKQSQKQKAPVQEVVVESDTEAAAAAAMNTSIYTTPRSGGEEEDTFFDDPSLAQRAKRTLRQPSPRDTGRNQQQRSLLSSPDAQPRMARPQNHTNMQNDISAMSSFMSEAQQPLNDTHISGDEVVRVHESALQALQQLKEEL
ncbi:MAG: hypothetical protein SGARI_004719, partial [Bacillariaceae sp.]